MLLRALVVAAAAASACTVFTDLSELSGGGPDGGRTAAEGDSTADGGSTADGAPAIDGASTTDGALDDANASDGGSRYRSEVLADAPVAYWRLGERSGTVAADESGHSHAATYQDPAKLGLGSPGALTGDPDPSLELKGGHVLVGDDFDFADHAFSIELWLKIPADVGGSYPRALEKTSLLPQHEGWRVEVEPTGKASFVLEHAGASAVVSASLTANAFVHLVFTSDRSKLRLYRDGNLTSEDDVPFPLADTLAPLRIGCASDGFVCLTGAIDEVALYDTELLAPRVSAHYHAGRP